MPVSAGLSSQLDLTHRHLWTRQDISGRAVDATGSGIDKCTRCSVYGINQLTPEW